MRRRIKTNPPRGMIDPDEGWQNLALGVLATAANDYRRARMTPGGDGEAMAISNYLLDPNNPWSLFANIDPDFYIDIVARIDDEIDNGEYRHAIRA